MRFRDGVRSALASLVTNPLRTFLTLLGIIIGVTAIVTVASVINGLDTYVAEKLSDLGPGAFVINRFGLIKSREEFLKAIRRNPDIRIADARAIRERVALAHRVGIRVEWGRSVKRGDRIVEDVSVGGITPEVIEIQPFDIEAGRNFTREELAGAQPVAFIGYAIAEELFGALDPIGRTVKIVGRSFRVVGVAAKRGSVFGQSRDNFVQIPLSTFLRIFGSRLTLSISVQVRDPERMDEAIEEVRAVLRARHHLSYHDEDDFGIITAEGIQGLWKSLTRTLFRVAIFVVGISLVVGGIVIMNIMLLSVIERTREIGIRKAVGARQADIRFQFLVESAVLSAVGGIVGVGFGWLAAWGARTFTPVPAQLPVWAPFVAVLLAGSIGIFFGIHPAKQAAALDPIEALRFEEV
ncbi:MAG: ABC transporter permease [Planctomycetes bacterium]|nr:ABC transporter permease [Planctomycetota bacterium]